MNLSETVFVAKAWNKESVIEPNRYTIRWFTPNLEVPLCGHATLATSRVVFDLLVKDGTNKIIFETKLCGTLEAVIDRKRDVITIDLPSIGLNAIDANKDLWVQEIIETTLRSNLDTDLVDDIQYSEELKYLVLRLKETKDQVVSQVSPEFSRYLQIKTSVPLKVVIITQKADPSEGIHFYSRAFAPWFDVNEDPVCGSAHAVLAPYWKNYYEANGYHTEELIGLQLSKRSGVVICKVEGDRVRLSGKTRTFLTGIINI